MYLHVIQSIALNLMISKVDRERESDKVKVRATPDVKVLLCDYCSWG